MTPDTWSASGLIPPSTAMVGFAAYLRLHGFAVGAGEAASALGVLAAQGATDAASAKSVLRLMFASDRAEWERFGDLFDDYWQQRDKRLSLTAVGYSATTRHLWNLPPNAGGDDTASGEDSGSHDDGDGDNAANEARLRRQASRRGGRERLPPPAGTQWRELGEHLWHSLSRCRSRRYIPHRRGRGADLRQTLRRSVCTGGEPLLLLRRQRKKKRVRLSVLLDVSASMQAHSVFFLLLLKGMLRGAQAEGFVFHTHLVRITSSLRGDSGVPALEKFALQTQGMGGGTRIAHCVQDFSRCYGGRCLGGRSAVLIVSDGYDSEPPEQLQQAMRFLRRRTPRIFWLSPSLAAADVADPPPRALAVARPFLTALAPARTPEEVAQAAKMWAAL